MNSYLSTSKAELFSTATLPPHLRQRFHFTLSLPRQKRGRKTSQFFTFIWYESYSIFLCSISSPFFMNLLQRYYKLNFDFFQLPPPPTEDPFFWFLQPHLGLGWSHFSDPQPMTHYRECGPLGSGMIIVRMEGGMSHVPHTWFYCFVWLTFFDDQPSHRPAELARSEKSWKKKYDRTQVRIPLKFHSRSDNYRGWGLQNKFLTVYQYTGQRSLVNLFTNRLSDRGPPPPPGFGRKGKSADLKQLLLVWQLFDVSC